MMRHVSCILLLEWSTTSVPYAQKDPRIPCEKRRGQPREFWSLVSTIDGSTLPQDCVDYAFIYRLFQNLQWLYFDVQKTPFKFHFWRGREREGKKGLESGEGKKGW